MVNVGIVGLGYWGPNLVRNFASKASCNLIWACDKDQKRQENIRRQYPSVKTTGEYADLLNDPSLDLILVATPTSSHFELAKKALEAGKHVFIEKPMTSTPDEAQELSELASQKNKLLFVDHTFVFAPAVQKMKELAENGTLGDLLYFESQRINLGRIQKDTNVIFDLAIHDLSILHTIKNLNTAKSISAHGSKHFGEQIEQAHLHLTFDDAFSAHIHVSWLSPVKIRETILAGTKAMVEYDDTEPSEKLRVYDSGIDHDSSKPDPFFPVYRSGDVVIPALSNEETLSIEASHVLKCIEEQGTPIVSGEDGALIVRMLHKANESLAHNSAIIPLS